MEIGIVIMGGFVGLLVGLTGVGGAAIMTPLLVMAGIHPSIAVGTDLCYNAVTKLFGTLQHYRQQSIRFVIVKYYALGSIPGAIMAIMLMQIFDTFFGNQERWLKLILGVVLIFISMVTLFNMFCRGSRAINRWQLKSDESKKGFCIGLGFVLGFIVGLTSIGSGSLFAISILYLYRIRSAQVVGTDIAHAFLLVTVAGFMHAMIGHVDYGLMGNLLLGSIPGIIIGSMLCTKVPSRPMRVLIAALVFVSGLKLL